DLAARTMFRMAQDGARRGGGRDDRKPPNLRSSLTSRSTWIMLLVLLAVNFFVTNLFLSSGQPARVDISSDTFKAQVVADNVVSMNSTGRDVVGKTKKAVPATSDTKQKSTNFHTVVPAFAGGDLEPLLEE